jgi:signal recognition particle subunit SRP54
MFSLLTDKLEDAFRKLRGLGKISESNIADAMKDIRMALLEADVDFTVTKDLIKAVTERSQGEEVLRTVSPGQMIVKIFQDELAKVLGSDATELDLSPPQRILMVGLNGAGKTTTSAKLANWLKKQGKRPLLIALDLYRPAAITQLQVLGQQLGVPVCVPPVGETDPVKATKAALKWLEEQGSGVAIFDTAGRQEVDDELLRELKQVRDLVQPRETLLVADAATGQQAVSVATKFHETVTISGLIMTKLDGDARGGALLSMRQVTGCPVKFLGVGEKVEQLEVFHPDRMAQRILEKAAEEIDEKQAMSMMRRFEENKFDFNDFLGQLKFMKKLGPLEGILGMLPGMGALKNMPGVDDKKLKHTEAIILSMTPKERAKPDILNGSRRKRIAAGSGRPVMEINQLVQQYEMMKKLMGNKGMMSALAGGMMGGGGMGGLAGMMGGGKMPQMPKGMFPGLGAKPNKLGKFGKRPKLGG